MSLNVAPPHVILFDMDGTLTVPLLDYPRIKTEMGIGQVPIIEKLATMEPVARARAEAILHRHEDEAARLSTLNPGCRELLEWLKSVKIRFGIVTRNRRSCAQTTFEKHGLSFDYLITRDDGPCKPQPYPILHACRHFQADPAHVWMVGDGAYDIESANAAGVRSVWISHNQKRDFAALPQIEVANLNELLVLLKEAMHQADRS